MLTVVSVALTVETSTKTFAMGPPASSVCAFAPTVCGFPILTITSGAQTAEGNVSLIGQRFYGSPATFNPSSAPTINAVINEAVKISATARVQTFPTVVGTQTYIYAVVCNGGTPVTTPYVDTSLLNTSTMPNVNCVFPSPGTYSINLSVTWQNGGITTSISGSTISVNVSTKPLFGPPTVSLDGVVNGANEILTATATDQGGAKPTSLHIDKIDSSSGAPSDIGSNSAPSQSAVRSVNLPSSGYDYYQAFVVDMNGNSQSQVMKIDSAGSPVFLPICTPVGSCSVPPCNPATTTCIPAVVPVTPTVPVGTITRFCSGD